MTSASASASALARLGGRVKSGANDKLGGLPLNLEEIYILTSLISESLLCFPATWIYCLREFPSVLLLRHSIYIRHSNNTSLNRIGLSLGGLRNTGCRREKKGKTVFWLVYGVHFMSIWLAVGWAGWPESGRCHQAASRKRARQSPFNHSVVAGSFVMGAGGAARRAPLCASSNRKQLQ